MISSTPGRVHQGRLAFRRWRRARPCWGSFFVILSGLEIWGLTVSPYRITLVEGVAGVSALVILGLCATLALVCLIQPQQHAVVGSICLVVALASLALSNLGGFVLGMLLGVHGSSLMISWRPPDPDPAAGEIPMEAVPSHHEK
ncbi:MAG TPA: DUF6114 domain-containing protein [Kineosporiaceae bacterium]